MGGHIERRCINTSTLDVSASADGKRRRQTGNGKRRRQTAPANGGVRTAVADGATAAGEKEKTARFQCTFAVAPSASAFSGRSLDSAVRTRRYDIAVRTPP
jgi:hypothetical protein